MIIVRYAPTFVRMYKNLESDLKDEVKDKIELFKRKENHTKLKVHKLGGRLRGRHSFFVNFKIRIVFRYENKNAVNLLYVGSHDEVY